MMYLGLENSCLTRISDSEDMLAKLSYLRALAGRSRNRRCVPRRKQTGASMVEFSIVSLLCIVLTGAIIDFGLFIFHFALINYSLSRATRQIATIPDQIPDCGYISTSNGIPGLAQRVRNVFENELNSLGVDAAIEFHGRGFSPASGEGPPYWLEIEAEWLPVCFFCSALFRGLRVPLSARAILENRDSC